MKLLVNGQLTDNTEAVISVFDHGFLYGMGLFETFRTYNGIPWLLDKHIDRLGQGCEMLGIHYAADLPRMKESVLQLLKANGLEDGYFRWSVSAGEGAIGLPTETYEKPNEVVYVKALAHDQPADRKGKALRLLSLPRSTPEGSFRLKSFHYMNNIVAKRELNASGAAFGTEGLFLDGNGYIVEGMVSNVFWVTDGVLYTPAVHTGLLAGITREYVLQMAAGMGIAAQEGLYGWSELLKADEVFLTNSIQELVPVTTLENAQAQSWHPGGMNTAGPITYRLMTQYRAAAERNEAE